MVHQMLQASRNWKAKRPEGPKGPTQGLERPQGVGRRKGTNERSWDSRGMVGSRAVQFETWVLSFEARGLESKVRGRPRESHAQACQAPSLCGR